MIVQFTLHPTAFFLNGHDHAQQVAIIKAVERYWLHTGVYVQLAGCAGGEFAPDLFAALSPEVRRLWQELFKQANRRSRIQTCSKNTIGAFQDGPASCLRQLERIVELVCLDKENGVAFSIPPDKPCFSDPVTKIEVCRIDCVDASRTFSAAYGTLKGAFRKGETREHILKEFIEPHAKLNSKIVVVDRYIIERHIDGTGNPTGLVSILKSLNSLGNDSYLTIYSGVDTINPKDWIDKIRAALKALGPGSLTEVVVYLCPKKLFIRDVHHRYIKFGSDAALFLDFGLEVLESCLVERSCKYHYDWSRITTEDSETTLRQHVKPIKFERGNGLAKAPQKMASVK